ncbi:MULTISPECIES: helix-turn-helix transcriptional regulator [unclassified Rathayibacter]|uniref:helix-turn-helix transcriptional regulator n=1 Tax=unclassified Rathayibacter TaxID=2609250 RepID=UPI000700A52B|nr:MULTISPECIES: helix-turn-helix transcriptional regulator [unclassified Rathayibacter]KQQ05585.1 XRE family transcriptional regulator [Rathayibacter sp. Leaf294]KQS13446.1 XRE family transcriptional regulator [Rathayibacter sp. Leaf185]
MDTPNEIREFLISRRAGLTPEQAGLPDFGGRRRVVGLRREEVALLAGMSVEYYVRLERGNASGVSDTVLEGVSRALQLDDAERSHLYDLVRTANDGAHPLRRRRTSRPQKVRPIVQQILDGMRDVPALVQNGRLDVLATNRLGAAVFSPMLEQPHRPANFGRFVFEHPRAPGFYRDWDDTAAQTVALLRAEAGRAPYDRLLTDLIGELSTRSEPFRRLWASHDVREHLTGVKRLRHPVVGDLDLGYEGMELTNDRGLLLIAFSAPIGSASGEGLRLLGSWSASAGLGAQQTELS